MRCRNNEPVRDCVTRFFSTIFTNSMYIVIGLVDDELFTPAKDAHMTRQEALDQLINQGQFVTLREHYIDVGTDLSLLPANHENQYIDPYGDWVVTLTETGFELAMDGDPEPCDKGDFDYLAQLIRDSQGE